MNDDPCEMIGKEIRNSVAGEILSPNYPDHYPSRAYCQWVVEVDDDSLVQLTFTEFDLEEE